MSYNDDYDRRDPGRRCTLYVKNLSWDTSAAVRSEAPSRPRSDVLTRYGNSRRLAAHSSA